MDPRPSSSDSGNRCPPFCGQRRATETHVHVHLDRRQIYQGVQKQAVTKRTR